MLLPLALAATTACSASPQDPPAWRQISSADETAEQAPPDHTTDSLGDPFVLVADTLEPSRLAEHPRGPTSPQASPEQAWIMLSSDACFIDLVSLHAALRVASPSHAIWLTTTSPSHGIVTEASPRHVVVRFYADVRLERAAADQAPVFRPAIIDLEAHQQGATIRVEAHVVADDAGPDGDLRLDLALAGGFQQDPQAIPERNFACPL